MLLTQFVRHPDLSGGWIVDGKGEDGLLYRIVHAVLEIRSAPFFVRQRLQSGAFLDVLDAVERVARHAHHPASLRHIAQLVGQIQQAILGLMML